MQNGSITRSTRLRGPDVREYRWREAGADGKRKHRRMVIGSTAQFSDKSSALLEVAALRFVWSASALWCLQLGCECLCLFVPTKRPTNLRKCSCGTAGRTDLAALLFLFVPAKNRRLFLQVVDKIWRPRRDLNPCYRRERSRCNYKAAVATQRPVRNS